MLSSSTHVAYWGSCEEVLAGTYTTERQGLGRAITTLRPDESGVTNVESNYFQIDSRRKLNKRHILISKGAQKDHGTTPRLDCTLMRCVHYRRAAKDVAESQRCNIHDDWNGGLQRSAQRSSPPDSKQVHVGRGSQCWKLVAQMKASRGLGAIHGRAKMSRGPNT